MNSINASARRTRKCSWHDPGPDLDDIFDSIPRPPRYWERPMTNCRPDKSWQPWQDYWNYTTSRPIHCKTTSRLYTLTDFWKYPSPILQQVRLVLKLLQ